MIELLHNFSIFIRLFYRLIRHQLKIKKKRKRKKKKQKQKQKQNTKRMIFIYDIVEITSILYIFNKFNKYSLP